MLTVAPLIFLCFQPHGVDHREENGETGTENPSEIPHDFSSALVGRTIVGFDELDGNLAAHDAVGPTGIGDDDRRHDQRHPEHDAQRALTGDTIPGGEAAFQIGARWHDEGKNGDAGSENDCLLYTSRCV